MNKAELVEKVASSTDETKALVEKLIGKWIELVEEQVRSGNDVKYSLFGTFTSYERKQTEKRNPKTGKKVLVEKARVPKFKPSEEFKKVIR